MQKPFHILWSCVFLGGITIQCSAESEWNYYPCIPYSNTDKNIRFTKSKHEELSPIGKTCAFVIANLHNKLMQATVFKCLLREQSILLLSVVNLWKQMGLVVQAGLSPISRKEMWFPFVQMSNSSLCLIFKELFFAVSVALIQTSRRADVSLFFYCAETKIWWSE